MTDGAKPYICDPFVFNNHLSSLPLSHSNPPPPLSLPHVTAPQGMASQRLSTQDS